MNAISENVDPIEELYSIRQRISAQFGHDVRRLAVAAKEWMRRDQAEGRVYVSLPIARCKPVVV